MFKSGSGASAGQVTVALVPGAAAGTSVCLATYAGVDVVIDRVGWLVPNTGSGYATVAPQRIVDTRDGLGGARLAAGQVLRVDPGTASGWPSDATAAVVQLTAVGGADPGFLRAYACDQPMPDTSNLNTRGPDAYSSLATVPLAADGSFCVWTYAATDVVVDVQSAWAASSTTPLAPSESPYRVVDTRDGIGGTRLAAGGVLHVGASAWDGGDVAVLNVIAVNAAAAGFLTLYDCAQPRPGVSNVNYPAAGAEPDGYPAANAAQVPVAPGSELCVYASAAADVVVDVTGRVPV